MPKTTAEGAIDAKIRQERVDQSAPQTTAETSAAPLGPDGNQAPRSRAATPHSAEEFYARLTARPDVRAFLKRLAGR